VVVHLDDIRQFVCNVVLTPGRAEHDHRGANAQRRHRHHCDYHPVGPSVIRVHAQDATLGVADPLEDLKDQLGRHVLLFLLRGVVGLFPLGRELEALAPDLRLVAAAAFVYLDCSVVVGR